VRATVVSYHRVLEVVHVQVVVHGENVNIDRRRLIIEAIDVTVADLTRLTRSLLT